MNKKDIERLKIIKGRLEFLPQLMDEKGNGLAHLKNIYQDMKWLISKAEQVEFLQSRMEEIDLSIQGLVQAFTPYEQRRYDIRYSHVGKVNGAVRAINNLRCLREVNNSKEVNHLNHVK